VESDGEDHFVTNSRPVVFLAFWHGMLVVNSTQSMHKPVRYFTSSISDYVKQIFNIFVHDPTTWVSHKQ